MRLQERGVKRRPAYDGAVEENSGCVGGLRR